MQARPACLQGHMPGLHLDVEGHRQHGLDGESVDAALLVLSLLRLLAGIRIGLSA